MKRLLVLIAIFCIANAYPQNINSIHGGTFIMAIICSDGILIASDSRECFVMPGQDRPSSYVDSVKKIYNVRGLPIAFKGTANVHERFLSEIIKDYEKTIDTATNIFSKVNQFYEYLRAIYPVNDKNYKKNTTLTGGYINGQPWIVGGVVLEGMEAKKDSFETSDPITYAPFRKIWKKGMSCKILVPLVEKFILDYAKHAKPEEGIGGPISIVKIYPNNTWEFLKNDFKEIPRNSNLKAHKMSL